ncbi:hypothetical protein GGG16DRAFT_105497 [Schizophyllum commune]
MAGTTRKKNGIPAEVVAEDEEAPAPAAARNRRKAGAPAAVKETPGRKSSRINANNDAPAADSAPATGKKASSGTRAKKHAASKDPAAPGNAVDVPHVPPQAPAPGQTGGGANVLRTAKEPAKGHVGQEEGTAMPATMADADKDALIKRLQDALEAKNAKKKRPSPSSEDSALSGKDGQSNKKTKKRVIEVITKPEGSAGEPGTTGYNLQQVMRLNVGERRVREYHAIQNDMHRLCAKYDIDYKQAPFRDQDPVNLGKLFKRMYTDHPYLTPERFPSNWATSAMVQQYINEQRKVWLRKLAAQAAAAAAAGGAGTAVPATTGAAGEDDDEDDDDDHMDGAAYEAGGSGDALDDSDEDLF